jgi:hypothetical protein
MSSLFYTQDAFNLSYKFMFNEVEVHVICLFPIWPPLIFVKWLQFKHMEGYIYHKSHLQQ